MLFSIEPPVSDFAACKGKAGLCESHFWRTVPVESVRGNLSVVGTCAERILVLLADWELILLRWLFLEAHFQNPVRNNRWIIAGRNMQGFATELASLFLGGF